MTQDPNQPGDDENGYSAEGYESSGFDPNGIEEREQVNLGTAAPAVAAPQNRMVMIIFGVVIAVIAIVWLLFSGDSGPSEEELAKAQETVNVSPVVKVPEPLPEAPPPMEPTQPDLEQAQLPPLPLPPEEVVDKDAAPQMPPEDPNVVEARRRAEEDLRQRRLRSGMVVSGGAGGALGKLTGNSGSNVSSAQDGTPRDSNSQFERNVTRENVPVVEAERVSDLRTSIIQGKIINVVLESAINTDLPAPVRAIVSRDVYAEAGKTVLIPKGSRVIGKYNIDVIRGQKRVFIIWQRILRPDGVSVAVNSPGVDQLGRGGVEGMVDNKYLEIFSTAILTSMLTIGAAVAADQVVDGEVSTTNNSLGGSSSSGTAGAMAVQEAITNLSDSTAGVVSSAVKMNPTIMLDQGTRMNIFVNRDLTFPAGIQGGGTVIVQ